VFEPLDRIVAMLLAACIFPCGVAASAARAIALEDLGAVVSLSAATISPDGASIVLITSRQDFIDNRSVNSLWLVDAVSGAQSELAAGRPNVTSPRWSPGGDRLAWLDSRSDGTPQIHVLDLRDPGTAAKVVTDAPRGVGAFRWSPDGTTFAFLTEDAPVERIAEERHNRSFEAGDGDYLSGAEPTPSHMWIVPAAGGTASRLTRGAEHILSFAWQEGGRSIGFVSQPRSHHSGFLSASLNLIQIRDGSRRVLVPTPLSGGNGPVTRVWTAPPGGDRIVYGRPRGAEPDFRPLGVHVVAADGGGSHEVAPGLDLDLWREPVWLPGGRAMLLCGTTGTRASLWLQPAHGKLRRLAIGAVSQLESLSSSRTGALAFIGSESVRAPELYHMASTNAPPKRLTSFNRRITDLALGQVETVRWSVAGFDLTGVLNFPPGFVKEGKYPLVLLIHGGPMSASTEALGDFEGLFAQLLAAKGWLVFRPNYRGSTGGGARFQGAIINDLGKGPGRDVMAGVATLQARGIVDSDRMAVSGWSYGGFMTTWLAAHYPVWRAVVAGAAVTDWLDQYNLGDENVWSGLGLGGSPWLNGNAANYWNQSPIAHAGRIRAPTLILANSGDRRVPITQSYKLHHALKDNGVPTQFIVYPVDGHWPPDPVHQRDLHRRWMDWIDRHLHAAPAGQ
jgi:dipeptidyl aminopeptidase/acylaminoacyl peptidase